MRRENNSIGVEIARTNGLVAVNVSFFAVVLAQIQRNSTFAY
jgi:hypothetical protein